MWLDGAPTVGQGATNCSNYPYDGSGSGGTAVFPWTYTNSWWPYYPVYTASPARPIKLKMSEVERLRKAAKDDSKLKAILNKFTTQIEIEVDFD
jgi:hypothetical protein